MLDGFVFFFGRKYIVVIALYQNERVFHLWKQYNLKFCTEILVVLIP